MCGKCFILFSLVDSRTHPVVVSKFNKIKAFQFSIGQNVYVAYRYIPREKVATQLVFYFFETQYLNKMDKVRNFYHIQFGYIGL